MQILLIGNNVYVNAFIKQLLEDLNNADIIEQKSNLDLLLKDQLDAEEVQIDVLIIDFSAYGSSKILNKIEQVNTILPQTPILVIHDYQQPSLVKPLWNKGVEGYVPADRLNEELLPALSTIIEGERYISSDLLGEE